MTTKTPIREAAVAQAYDRSTIEIKLGADHGELLSAETVGGVITDVAKLLKLAAKDCGYTAEVLVRSIEYTDGEMRARLLVCRLAKGLKKRERNELARRMAEEEARQDNQCRKEIGL